MSKTKIFTKKIIAFGCTVFVILIVFYFYPNKDNCTVNRYTIFGSGEGAIMLDTATGEAWVLEYTRTAYPKAFTDEGHRSPTGEYFYYSLAPDKDFEGPSGRCYCWVPTAILPSYRASCHQLEGLCRSPEDARELEEERISPYKVSFNPIARFLKYCFN